METSAFLAGGRPAGPARHVPPHAKERPGADPGGGVVAAWAVFLALFLVLLATAGGHGAICVGGSGDPSAWLGAERSDAGLAPRPVSPVR